ncbi:hypothetical protein [Nocardia terpenica]|uniref:DUF8020 domain-containing protein n=1 Tax=Nocardia terpenica TaxID=455432 RepID=A0A164N7I5_9NOCA|nr:hypothetical protein [Nocardia terpenica]KZM74062.1 hypothetical protein AWN90_32225 [Nocardia terpenica]NQE87523.1 hypothetical protein [Nocardia terpenica]
MRIAKLAAAAVLSAAALGISAVTAHGEAGVATPTVSGADQGIAYTTTLAPDRSAVTTTLASGRFQVTPDGTAATVLSPTGTFVGSVPLVYDVAGRQVHVVPQVDPAGTTLTVRPANPADISAPTPETVALQNIGLVTLGAGVAIGCGIGAVIGVFFFVVGAIVGCAVGAVIGGAIGFFTPSP